MEMIDFNPIPFIVSSSHSKVVLIKASFLFSFKSFLLKFSTNNDSARRMFQCTPVGTLGEK